MSVSLAALALTTAISLIGKRKNGSQNDSGSIQREQILLEQERQREQERKRQQNILIVIGVSAFLILGAVMVYTMRQNDK